MWRTGGHATASEVRDFLDTYKLAVRAQGISIWSTEKNNRFMAETGFLVQDVERIVLGTQPHHYAGGPEGDDNPLRPVGEVWKFQQEYMGFDLYLKLKLSLQASVPLAECLSCHEQERAMVAPLRTQRGAGSKK